MYEDHQFALNKIFKMLTANRIAQRNSHHIRDFDTRLEEIEVRLGLRREGQDPNELPQSPEPDDTDFL